MLLTNGGESLLHRAAPAAVPRSPSRSLADGRPCGRRHPRIELHAPAPSEALTRLQRCWPSAAVVAPPGPTQGSTFVAQASRTAVAEMRPGPHSQARSPLKIATVAGADSPDAGGPSPRLTGSCSACVPLAQTSTGLCIDPGSKSEILSTTQISPDSCRQPETLAMLPALLEATNAKPLLDPLCQAVPLCTGSAARLSSWPRANDRCWLNPRCGV